MTAKPLILFVDDETNILQGLKRMLHSMSREWAMEFAQGGPTALALMAKTPVDILVTDMRMPGMDGAELLQRVRAEWPEVTRIVLSGHSDQEGVIRSINAAHQYLIKPCDPEVLKKTLRRALRLRNLVSSPPLRTLIARLNHVPSLPSLYIEISSALADKDCTVRQIGEIIGKDISFSVKLLQLVNSAFFGLPRSIATPADAAVLLGTELIRALVLGSKVFSSIEERAPATNEFRELWQHSLRTAVLARDLATRMKMERRDADEAFLAGFMHDVGRLVLMENLPDETRRCAELIHDGWSDHDAEMRVFGATHEVVTASLLGMWGLPDAAVEAVAFMHRPNDSTAQDVTALTALHVAEVFDSERNAMPRGHLQLDTSYLERLGLSGQVEQWRSETAAKAAQGGN